MNNAEKTTHHCEKTANTVEAVIEFIVKLITYEDGFEDFELSPKDRQELAAYLLKTHPSADTDIPPETQREMTLDGVDYLKHRQAYRDRQIQSAFQQVFKVLDEQNFPREHLAGFSKHLLEMKSFAHGIVDRLQPKDCAALQDWPERRKPVDEDSPRLENAGQFIQRLFDEKLYDEEKFGKLYLFDLRTINAKLYQALVQWQKRTGKKILANKRDEIDDLLVRKESDGLDFYDTSRASNALWRRQQMKAAQG